jgi:hypothetical protein
MQDPIKQFDEANISSLGSENFIQNAPKELGKALRHREKCEQPLPELMSIMSDYGKDPHGFDQDASRRDFFQRCGTSAIKHYLLWANFVGHYEIRAPKFVGRFRQPRTQGA